VPRLNNFVYSDREFTGWVGPIAERMNQGQRLYDDLVLPIPPGSFELLSINVDYPDFPTLERQATVAHELQSADPRIFHYLTTFSMKGFEGPNWTTDNIRRVDGEMAHGAVGVVERVTLAVTPSGAQSARSEPFRWERDPAPNDAESRAFERLRRSLHSAT